MHGRRVASILAASIILFFGTALPVLANVCCICVSSSQTENKGEKWCLTNATDVCANPWADPTIINAYPEAVRESVKAKWSCANSSSAPGEGQCRKIGETGICANAPMTFAQDAANMASQIQQAQAAVTAAKTGPVAPPVVPKLNVEIPNLTFSPLTQDKGKVYVPWLAEYINAVYKYMVSIVLIVATVMVTYGGFRYLIGSTMGDVKRGKEIMTDAIIGMIVVLCAYLILKTINPYTTKMVTMEIGTAVIAPADESSDVSQSPKQMNSTCTGPAILCSDADSCKKMCQTDPKPTCSPNVVDPSALVTIPDSQGLRGNGKQVKQELADKLKIAGQIAYQLDNSYVINITSGYRTLQKQIDLVCNQFGSGGDPSKIGTTIAKPGGSNHGQGIAVDVKLLKGGQEITCSDCSSGQSNEQYHQPSEILLNIMSKAGLTRYSAEIWHFELPGNSACRCQNTCPWPPKKTC